MDFLLGVMADSTADSKQRVKAAAVAARYKHAVAAPDPEAPSTVVADKFGFTVDRELARAERDGRLREATLGGTSHLRRKNSIGAKAAEQELERLTRWCGHRCLPSASCWQDAPVRKRKKSS